MLLNEFDDTGIRPFAITVTVTFFYLFDKPSASLFIVTPSISTKSKNERSLVEYLSLVTGLFIANKNS